MASNKKQILVPDISRRKPAKNRKYYVVHKKKKTDCKICCPIRYLIRFGLMVHHHNLSASY